jgi:hypothetical protein
MEVSMTSTATDKMAGTAKPEWYCMKTLNELWMTVKFWRRGSIEEVDCKTEVLCSTSPSSQASSADVSPTIEARPLPTRSFDRPAIHLKTKRSEDLECFKYTKPINEEPCYYRLDFDWALNPSRSPADTTAKDFCAAVERLNTENRGTVSVDLSHVTQEISEIKAKYKPPPEPVPVVPSKVEAPTVVEPVLATPVEGAGLLAGRAIEQGPSEVSIYTDSASFIALANQFKEEHKHDPTLALAQRQDVNEVVNQVTSDIDDLAHLQGRIDKLLTCLNQSADRDAVLIYLVEKICKYTPDLLENIENGLNFSHNFSKLVAGVAQHYPQVIKYYLLALASNSPILEPGKKYSAELATQREQFLDISPVGLNTEELRIKFTNYMAKTRGFAMLLGQLLIFAPHTVSIGFGWAWFSELANTPTQLIDRAAIPAMHGLLLTLHRTLATVYKSQWAKLFMLLKSRVFPTMKMKFQASEYSSYLNLLEKDLSRLAY